MNKYSFEEQDSFESSYPIIGSDSDDLENEMYELPLSLPIMPLRNNVMFPGVIFPISIGRESTLSLLKDSYRSDKIIGIVAQKQKDVEYPNFGDLYDVGTAVQIIKTLRLPNQQQTIIIKGLKKFKITNYIQQDPYFKAEIELYPYEMDMKKVELDAALRSIKKSAMKIVELSPTIPKETSVAINNISSGYFLLNFLSSNLNISVAEKYKLLTCERFSAHFNKVLHHLNKELQVLSLSEEINTRVRSDIDDQQRAFYLRQQLKTIQQELGENSEMDEYDNLRKRAKEKKLKKDVLKVFNKELSHLERTPSSTPNHGIIYAYLEWILDLPWNEYSIDCLNIDHAIKILDKDHYGLTKIKKRIVSYLSVLSLKQDMRSPILCFLGPPGVGKTSLGKSIARAMKRNYQRISLGGMRDEAEIRGHRRTYIGAMPGRILKAMKQAGTINPIIVLDEIDKVGKDMWGDPSSALLEVLDPEQNHAFSDNYLELPYDLSRVLFLATANNMETIPSPLKDRMEIIHLNGYTPEEKYQIAKRHLIKKQIKENGLKNRHITFTKNAVMDMITNYTRESGVRDLERKIGMVCREIAQRVVKDDDTKEKITPNSLNKHLGKKIYYMDSLEKYNVPGVVIGLAWTPHGGEILFIESTLSEGTGKIKITGQLGDIMKESAHLAHSYIRSHAKKLDIPPKAFEKWDIHIHVPAGAVPKDGPSAGVAILSSMASIYTQRRVKEKLALSGEITLRGSILPVGGIKEKFLAAHRAGMDIVLLPERNRADVDEIDKDILSNINVHYMKKMNDIFSYTLQDKAQTDVRSFYKLSS